MVWFNDLMKYVVTGGPCSGKTSVIEVLETKGYRIIEEAARLVIKNGNVFPWVDLGKFQDAILKKQLELEKSLEGDIMFLDRGLIDGVAYYKFANIKMPDELVMVCKENRYDKVFLLDMLVTYESDLERKEDEGTAERIHRLVKESYEEFNYKIIEVPVMDVEERVKFILENLD